LGEALSLPRQTDFLGVSYGFRPGRSPHHALDALAAGIVRKKVNWVLDADFREFFTSLDHRWLEKFLEHRIADRRVLRLIQKWMAAGVIEDGAWTESVEGVPQGASASPLLANVYAHYVFDLWAHQWRKRHAHGDMVIVRFADDAVVGFEHRDDAERFWADLRGRLARFNLELNAEKTRLIEFGRFAARDRMARGLGKPETFRFLGFTNICGERRTTGMREGNALAWKQTRRHHVPLPTSAPRGHAPYQDADHTQRDEPLAQPADPSAQPNPQGLDQLPPPRRKQPLLRLPQPLPVVASDPVAVQETRLSEIS
jgi:group II intron reverse transcriptase/maturase